MAVTGKQAAGGYAVYTGPVLALYDSFVLGFSNRFVWNCPTKRIVRLYDSAVSANHLEVGPGTGFYLTRVCFPSKMPRIAMMDKNRQCLEHAGRLLSRYHPETYHADILEPLTVSPRPFDSVGLNYVLHCLPGSLPAKAAVFKRLKNLMNPGAVLFGSTILHSGVARGPLARLLMGAYNVFGIFTNSNDDLAGLTRILGEQFSEVSVEAVGCVALFSARV